MATLPTPTFYWRVSGAADDAWTEDTDGVFDPTDGATVEVVSVGPSLPRMIVADTVIAAIGMIDAQEVNPGDALSLDVSGNFTGTNLIYSLRGAASGASIDSATGVVTWTAPAYEAAPVVGTVIARNSTGASTQSLSLASVINLEVIAPITYTTTTGPKSTGGTLLTSPASATLPAVANSTGTIFYVHSAVDIDSVTLDGVEMERVSSIRTYADGETAAYVANTFYSDAVGGDVVISSRRGVDLRMASYAINPVGGTVRSWDQVQSTNYAIPATAGSGIAVDIPAFNLAKGDLVLGIMFGDSAKTLSGATWTTAATYKDGSTEGRIQTLYATEAGTLDTSFGSSGYRDYIGLQAIVLGQLSADRITLDEPKQINHVYALNTARTSASVPVSGSYVGSGGIEVRVVDSAGTEVSGWISATVDSGAKTFSADITVAANDAKLLAEARFAAAPSITFIQNDWWRVGLQVFFYGQSNQGYFYTRVEMQALLDPRGLAYFVGTRDFDRQVGDGVTAFVNSLIAETGHPTMAVCKAVGGSSIQLFVPGSDFYVETAAEIDYYGFQFNAMCLSQGEDNVPTITTVGEYDDYRDAVESIQLGYAAQSGRAAAEFPLLISSLGSYGGANAAFTSERWSLMRKYQKQLGADLTGVYWACADSDLVRFDTFHSYGRSYVYRAQRLVHYLGYLFGDNPSDGIFNIGSVAATDTTTTTVTVTHALGTDMEVVTLGHEVSGTGLVGAGSTSDVQGFEVTEDDWVTAVACAGVVTNATTITLTHPAISTSGRKLRYLYQRNPAAGGLVRDNSTIHATLTYEYSLDAA